MGIFKKTKELTPEDSISRLNDLANSCDVLIKLCDDFTTKTKIRRLKDNLYYSKPAITPESEKIETKIKKMLDDLKILLTQNIYQYKIEQTLKDIDLLIIERNNKA